jgi:hypothetical protein
VPIIGQTSRFKLAAADSRTLVLIPSHRWQVKAAHATSKVYVSPLSPNYRRAVHRPQVAGLDTSENSDNALKIVDLKN